MNKDAEQPAPQGDDFEKRHSEQLGIKRFAKVQATYTFLPLLTMAAGAAAGYYALARPVAKLFPKINRNAGMGEVAIEKLSKAVGSVFHGDNLEEIFKDFKPTREQLEKLNEVWSKESTLHRSERLGKSVEILNLELPKVAKVVRFSSTGAGAVVGGMAGGIAVGYDQWHKEESARLAAQEINHDVANLELFKPSDPELLAENKRLSAMVAALPTIEAATVEQQGRLEEKQQAASK